jgi:hypothetical protein
MMDQLNKSGLSLMGGMRLFVERGLHAGASLVSKQGSITIGAAAENDVVLLADQLAARHMRVVMLNPWTNKARLEAFDQPIDLPDGRRIETGHFVDLSLPAKFRIGTAECRVETVREASTLKKFGIPALALLLAAFLLPSIAGLFSFSSSRGALPSPSVTTSSAPNGLDVGALAGWQDKLVERLRNAGLTGQVNVERGQSGNLVAFGAIEDTALDKWRDVLKWYDSQGSAPLLVNNVMRGAAQTVLPSIRTVWIDANPQVVLLNGQTAGIGDTIPGGWKIEAIEVSGVLLSRDGRTTRIAF